MQDRQITKQIRDRVAQLLRDAAPLCERHGTRLPEPDIHFDLKGQAAGQARWSNREAPRLRFNLDIARRHAQDFIDRTVVHEVAHLLTAACHGRTRPHGREWLAMMRYLGIKNPQRCHNFDLDETQVRRQRRWAYSCECSAHHLTTTRHRRVKSGKALYLCRRCGKPLRELRRDPPGAGQ